MRMRTRSRTLLAAITAGGVLLAGCGGADDETEEDGAAEETADEQAVAEALTIAADTVSGPANIPAEERAGAVCVLQSRFPRNSEIVWRARVMDSTGDELDEEALDSVQVVLASGETLDMRYGPHPNDDPTDFFWTAALDVPADHPTGTLDYEIVATGVDGAAGEFRPFEVSASLLTITDEVLETIEEEA